MNVEILELRTLLASPGSASDDHSDTSWAGHAIHHEESGVTFSQETSKPESSLLDSTLTAAVNTLFVTANLIPPTVGFAASGTFGLSAVLLVKHELMKHKGMRPHPEPDFLNLAITSILLSVADNLISRTLPSSWTSPFFQYTTYGASLTGAILGITTGLLTSP